MVWKQCQGVWFGKIVLPLRIFKKGPTGAIQSLHLYTCILIYVKREKTHVWTSLGSHTARLLPPSHVKTWQTSIKTSATLRFVVERYSCCGLQKSERQHTNVSSLRELSVLFRPNGLNSALLDSDERRWLFPAVLIDWYMICWYEQFFLSTLLLLSSKCLVLL